MKKLFILFLFWIPIISCKEKTSSSNATPSQADTLQIDYAKGFSIIDYENYKILEVKNPFPDSDVVYTYLLSKKNTDIPTDIAYDEKIEIPIKNAVVTSTTHIPALESLEVEKSLIGFPHTDYISSSKTRKLIEEDKITNLGENENINIEILLSLQPDAVVGFAMKENNKVYANISRSGIPVVFNGDWNEESPLGKAEWIKFFGALYDKDEKAKEIFDDIKENYNSAKKISQNVENKPTVISGAMYKDIWNLTGGKSWMAEFIADAGGDYLYKNTAETGSLSLSFESVFNQAQQAEIWIAPAGFTSFEEMQNNTKHYAKFKAFENKEVYTYALTKGETGGVLYFELAPNRPDLVLKDLINIFHPELLSDYENSFFKPLK